MGDEENDGASLKELLIEACRRNNTDLLSECLEGKSDAEISQLLNETATIMGNHLYHEAASHGHYDIIDLLLDQPDFECDPLNRTDHDTPLHLAIRWINAEPPAQRPFGLALVEMMLEAGSNPRIPNKAGITPLQLVDPANVELRDLMQNHEPEPEEPCEDDVGVSGAGHAHPAVEDAETDDAAEFSGSDDEERVEWERRRKARGKM